MVDQAGGTVDVTPTADTLTALGQTTQLAAAAKDALGYAVTGAAFTWQSSDTVVATVDTTGLVTSVGNGSATITATSGGRGAHEARVSARPALSRQLWRSFFP